MDNRSYDGIKWSKTKDGYWVNGKHGYQHRYVYEKLTGLKVFDYQVVHHLDGDKSNNTVENLVCMTKEDHAYLHCILDDRGRRWGAEARKGNKRMLGKHHSEETKRKIAEASKNRSIETRKKLSRAAKGRMFTEEHKQKISEARTGQHLSEETKKKLSEAFKGKTWKYIDGKRVYFKKR